MILLDLFAGRLGWSKAFLARGWKVYAVDLIEPPEVPHNCQFIKADVLTLGAWTLGCSLWTTDGKLFLNCFPDFIVASSPCEQFSKFGMRSFNPNPAYPELGIKLFNYTRSLCEASGVPYVMENVRAAQQFIGNAVHHCGPFYLWGNAVPPILNQGIIKGMTRRAIGHKDYKGQPGWNTKNTAVSKRLREEQAASFAATIPPELANCVADYAERLLERPAPPQTPLTDPHAGE